jgi:hypothetical protein
MLCLEWDWPMKRKITIGVSLLALGMVSACATYEPEPCSPDWVELRVTQALVPLARDSRSQINALKRAADTLQSDKPAWQVAVAAMEIARVLPDLADRFETVSAPRLEEIGRTCGKPDILLDAFVDFLADEGVDPDVLMGVANLRALIASAENS